MRITAVTAEPVSVRLYEPFVISLAAIETTDLVFVTITTDAGITGHGEGAGVPFVTGETTQSVLAAIEAFQPALIGQNPFSIEHLHREMDRILVRNGAAKAAVDLALYDIMGQAAGLPLYQFLGGVASSVEVDQTIGIDDPAAMAAKAAQLAAEGYHELKIKAGSNDAHDRAAIALIRQAAPAAHLKVDANQGWSVPQALAMLNYLTAYDVGAVEQPLPYWDTDGLAYVRSRSPIPIMADESCFTPHDASLLVRKGAADIINIKLMKCGGIFPALQINAVAEAAGVRCMLGCMVESRLGIAAGAHLVASHPNFIYADLDSFRDFDDSTVIATAFNFEAPYIRLTDQPGLGVVMV